MGSYIVDTTKKITRDSPFTVIYSHDMPMNMGVAAIHYTMVYAVDMFAAADICLKGVGSYGTLLFVLAGHHKPVLQGEMTHIWDQSIKYQTVELKVTTIKHLPHPATKPITRKRKKKTI